MLNLDLTKRTIRMLISNILSTDSTISHRHHRFFNYVKNDYVNTLEEYVKQIPVERKGKPCQLMAIQNDLRCIYAIGNNSADLCIIRLETIIC